MKAGTLQSIYRACEAVDTGVKAQGGAEKLRSSVAALTATGLGNSHLLVPGSPAKATF